MDKSHYQQNMATHCKTQTQTPCLQINLQHSRSATYSLMKIIETEEQDVIFVQEPYEYQNKPVRIVKKHSRYRPGVAQRVPGS
jgi:hypothetical protein